METQLIQAQAPLPIDGLRVAHRARTQSVRDVRGAGQISANHSDVRGDKAADIKEDFGEWTCSAYDELLVRKLIDG
jgi:hypothetical protein